MASRISCSGSHEHSFGPHGATNTVPRKAPDNNSTRPSSDPSRAKPILSGHCLSPTVNSRIAAVTWVGRSMWA